MPDGASTGLRRSTWARSYEERPGQCLFTATEQMYNIQSPIYPGILGMHYASTGIALSGQGLKLCRFIDKTDSLSLSLSSSTIIFSFCFHLRYTQEWTAIGIFPSGSVELWAGFQFKGIL